MRTMRPGAGVRTIESPAWYRPQQPVVASDSDVDDIEDADDPALDDR
jgi:hypothetical protein